MPVIVERARNKTDVPDIDKAKFLVPSDLTVGQFVYVIRKRLSLSADKALFVFVGAALPPTSQLMREVYAQHADREDGLLYVRYSGESTFGAHARACARAPGAAADEDEGAGASGAAAAAAAAAGSSAGAGSGAGAGAGAGAGVDGAGRCGRGGGTGGSAGAGAGAGSAIGLFASPLGRGEEKR